MKYVKKILVRKNFVWIFYLVVLLIIFLILVIPSGKLIYARGSGTREYNLNDFWIAKAGNMTNNPIGVGLGVMIFFSLSLIKASR